MKAQIEDTKSLIARNEAERLRITWFYFYDIFEKGSNQICGCKEFRDVGGLKG